jgi:NAD(P)-dependent dehydrogenase (short-subunit alcohol dehydrogenase family)
MSKVWLVTGSASGLGRNTAEAVLASGDRLVATARDPRRLEDLVEKYGDQIRTAPLDVTDEREAYAAVQVAMDAFGRLDVVVNNAGYGDIAPFEQLSTERFKSVVDTNFYGVVNVCRAAIPIMRTQKSGCILQISSVGGRLARPGNTPYHAAKWAVGGFTESLAQEVAPFGVKVCALEPGGMRTNWGARANQDTPDLLPDYEPSVGSVVKALASYWGHETSDPVKVAQVILRLAAADRLPAHLLLGSDAAKHAGDAEATRATQSAGETSACRPTSTHAGHCLMCDSERDAGRTAAEPAVAADRAGMTVFRAISSFPPALLLNWVLRRTDTDYRRLRNPSPIPGGHDSMSHVVTIQTKVHDPAAVAAACQRLNLAAPVQGTARLYSGEASGRRDGRAQRSGLGNG